MQLVSNNKLSATHPGCQSLPSVVTLAAGVVVAYTEFSSVRDPVADLSTLILCYWIVILGIFMWRKTSTRKVINRYNLLKGMYMLMSTHPRHVEGRETEKAGDCYFDL